VRNIELRKAFWNKKILQILYFKTFCDFEQNYCGSFSSVQYLKSPYFVKEKLSSQLCPKNIIIYFPEEC